MQGGDPVVEITEGPASSGRMMRLSKALQLAGDYAGQGNVQTAQTIYSQLVDQCPTRCEPAVYLLRSYCSVANMDAAERHAYRMMALLKNDANAVCEAAYFFALKGDAEKAMGLLSEGLKNCPRECHAILYRNIGNIYDDQGEVAKASELYRKALAISQNDVLSLYWLTKIEKNRSRDELLDRLLTLKRSGSAVGEEIPYLHFALAYLYENNDNEKYFYYLGLANKAAANNSERELNRLTSEFENAVENLTRAHVEVSYRRKAIADRPPIFIVAPPRSGTTLLEQILGAHPETISVGESGAFVASVNRIYPEVGGNSRFWLWGEELLHNSLPKLEKYFFSNERIPKEEKFSVVDKSIENLQYVGLILLTWPQTRIIRLKRHPLDTILSCYHHFFSSGFDYLFDLESLARYYIIVQKYMDFWQDLFPDNIMTMEYEALVSDQEQQTRSLLEFCRLPWNDDCLRFYENVGTVLTASNLQVRQPLYQNSIGKWRPFVEQLQPAIRILEQELKVSFAIE